MRAITTDRLLEIQTELSSSYMDLLGVKRVKKCLQIFGPAFLGVMTYKRRKEMVFL